MTGLRGFAGAIIFALASVWALAAVAADRDQLRAFLEVTGFDVAITSMQQGAMAGPGIAGDAPGNFGNQWVKLAERTFDPELMLERAVDMMAAVMPDPLVTHGAEFYASDLGQRLVAAENESHVTPDEERYAKGEQIIARLMAENTTRVEDYQAMGDAIGGIDASVRAVIEIQVRYLLAAMSAGSAEIDYSEEELRALLTEQAHEVRANIEAYSLLGSAYAYRDFSDGDVSDYRAALEEAEMRQVYEVLNAIQFEIMAERYEVLAAELAKLSPQQDI